MNNLLPAAVYDIRLRAQLILRRLTPPWQLMDIPRLVITQQFGGHAGQYDPLTNEIRINLHLHYNPMDTEYIIAHEWWHWRQFYEGRAQYINTVVEGKDASYVDWMGTNYHVNQRAAALLSVNYVSYPDAPWEIEADVFAYAYCTRNGIQMSTEAIHRQHYLLQKHEDAVREALIIMGDLL